MTDDKTKEFNLILRAQQKRQLDKIKNILTDLEQWLEINLSYLTAGEEYQFAEEVNLNEVTQLFIILKRLQKYRFGFRGFKVDIKLKEELKDE